MTQTLAIVSVIISGLLVAVVAFLVLLFKFLRADIRDVRADIHDLRNDHRALLTYVQNHLGTLLREMGELRGRQARDDES